MQKMGRERHRVFVKSGVTLDTTEELLQRHFSTFGTVTDVYIPRSLPGPTPKGFAYVSFETDDAVQNAVKEAVHEIEGKHYPVGRAEPRPAERTTWHHEDRKSLQITEPLLPWPPRYSRSLSPRGLLPGPHGGLPRLDIRSPLIPTPRLPLEAGPLGDYALYLSRPSPAFTEGYGVDGRVGISAGVPDLQGDRNSRSTRLFVGGLPDALVERHIRVHFQKYGNVEDVYFPRERHTGKRRGFCFVRFDTPGTAHLAAARSPRAIQGHEVGEIKVATERPDDIVSDKPLEFGLDVDRIRRAPERGYGAARGHGPERGFGLERGHNLERSGSHIVAPLPYYELPRQLPGELSRELLRDFPGELRRDFPRQFQREIPRELPREFAGELPREFAGDMPRGFPGEVPRDLPGQFPGDLSRVLTRDYSREMPRNFDGRVSIRYRPY